MAIVLGIAAAIPPIGFFVLFVLLMWTPVVGILIHLRADAGDAEPARA